MATSKTAIAPMKAAQILRAEADFEIVEREIPKPEARQVRIKVQACGDSRLPRATMCGFRTIVAV